MPHSHHSTRNQNGVTDTPASSDHNDAAAERMGILSLTLSPSPVIRWILPARIRSRRHNDVVFVGSTYVHLLEFFDTGRLSETIAKLDFGTQILGAKVISAKHEVIPMMSAILDQEWDEERFLIRGMPIDDDQPPQILVLATALNELIYIYAKTSHDNNSARLVFAKRSLLEDSDISEKYLRHMAIDLE